MLHSVNSGEHQRLKAGEIGRSRVSPRMPTAELTGNLLTLSCRAKRVVKGFAEPRRFPAARLTKTQSGLIPSSALVCMAPPRRKEREDGLAVSPASRALSILLMLVRRLLKKACAPGAALYMSPSLLGRVRLGARQAQEGQEGRCRRHRSRQAHGRESARVRTAGRPRRRVRLAAASQCRARAEGRCSSRVGL